MKKEIIKKRLADKQKLRKGFLERWEKTNILKSCPEESQEDLAVMLENQRLHNERWNPDPRFKRISIPLIVRTFVGLLKKGYTVGSDIWVEKSLAFCTDIKMFPELPMTERFCGPKYYCNLDMEAEHTAAACGKLVDRLGEFLDLSGSGKFNLLAVEQDNNDVMWIHYFFEK